MMQHVIDEGFMHDDHLDHFETATSLEAMSGYLKQIARA